MTKCLLTLKRYHDTDTSLAPTPRGSFRSIPASPREARSTPLPPRAPSPAATATPDINYDAVMQHYFGSVNRASSTALTSRELQVCPLRPFGCAAYSGCLGCRLGRGFMAVGTQLWQAGRVEANGLTVFVWCSRWQGAWCGGHAKHSMELSMPLLLQPPSHGVKYGLPCAGGRGSHTHDPAVHSDPAGSHGPDAAASHPSHCQVACPLPLLPCLVLPAFVLLHLGSDKGALPTTCGTHSLSSSVSGTMGVAQSTGRGNAVTSVLNSCWAPVPLSGCLGLLQGLAVPAVICSPLLLPSCPHLLLVP